MKEFLLKSSRHDSPSESQNERNRREKVAMLKIRRRYLIIKLKTQKLFFEHIRLLSSLLSIQQQTFTLLCSIILCLVHVLHWRFLLVLFFVVWNPIMSYLVGILKEKENTWNIPWAHLILISSFLRYVFVMWADKVFIYLFCVWNRWKLFSVLLFHLSNKIREMIFRANQISYFFLIF